MKYQFKAKLVRNKQSLQQWSMKRREFICTEKNPDSSHSNYAEEQRWLDRRILLSGEWSPMLLLRRMAGVELETRGVVDEKTSGNNSRQIITKAQKKRTVRYLVLSLSALANAKVFQRRGALLRETKLISYQKNWWWIKTLHFRGN